MSSTRQVNDILDEVDVVIVESMSVRACARSTPREKGLPVVKKMGKPKIHRTLVDPDWLEDHAEDDTPLRIQEIEEEPQRGCDADSGEEEGMYADPEEYYDGGDAWGGRGHSLEEEYSPEGDM